jgi:hypothetical protein
VKTKHYDVELVFRVPHVAAPDEDGAIETAKDMIEMGNDVYLDEEEAIDRTEEEEEKPQLSDLFQRGATTTMLMNLLMRINIARAFQKGAPMLVLTALETGVVERTIRQRMGLEAEDDA